MADLQQGSRQWSEQHDAQAGKQQCKQTTTCLLQQQHTSNTHKLRASKVPAAQQLLQH
jgi:hypothetical protein